MGFYSNLDIEQNCELFLAKQMYPQVSFKAENCNIYYNDLNTNEWELLATFINGDWVFPNLLLKIDEMILRYEAIQEDIIEEIDVDAMVDAHNEITWEMEHGK